MTTLIIQVTAEDIEKGTKQSCHSCPIARAIRRALADHGPFTLEVLPGSVTLGHRRYPLPTPATEFIERFDDGGAVEPFSFMMEVQLP